MTEEKEEDANECLRFVSLKLVFALFCADVLEPMEKKLFEIMMKKNSHLSYSKILKPIVAVLTSLYVHILHPKFQMLSS